MKQIFIHFGLSKTGTTAIQETLASDILPLDWHFLSFDKTGNSSDYFRYIFSCDPLKDPKEYALKTSLFEIQEKGKSAKRKLASEILGHQADKFIISAEIISSFTIEEFQTMHEWFKKKKLEPIYIAYVRPFEQFVASAWQQAMWRFPFGKFPFNYYQSKIDVYKNLHQIISFLDSQQLKLFPYDRSLFINNNIIEHFYHVIGLKRPALLTSDHQFSNASMPLGAAKCLYIYLNHGADRVRGPRVMEDHYQVIFMLKEIFKNQHKTYGFSHQLLNPLIDSHTTIFKDISKCLKYDISKLGNFTPDVFISCEQDLLKLDKDELHFLEISSFSRGDLDGSIQSIIEVIQNLRNSIITQNKLPPYATNRPTAKPIEEELPNKHKIGQKIGLIGFYKHLNFGDDLLAALFYKRLSEWTTRELILFDVSEKLAECLDVEANVQWDTHYHECTHIIFGGGGVLGELDSGASIFKEYCDIIKTLRESNISYSFIAVGAGPLNSDLSRLMVSDLVQSSEMTIVRDEESKSILEDLPEIINPIFLGIDFAFSFKPHDIPQAAFNKATNLLQKLPHPILGLNFINKNCHNETTADIEYANLMHEQIITLCKKYRVRSIIVLINQADPSEAITAQDFLRKLDSGFITHSYYHSDPWSTLALISMLDLMFTMKLHLAIAAYLTKVPVACIGYHPKCERFFTEVNKKSFHEPLTQFSEDSSVLSSLFIHWQSYFEDDSSRTDLDQRTIIMQSQIKKLLKKFEIIEKKELITSSILTESIPENIEFELIKNSGCFDISFYLDQSPQHIEDYTHPILHYLDIGTKQNLDPSSDFSTSYYLNNNLDVAESGLNPLHHFILYGKSEGRLTQKANASSHSKLILNSGYFDIKFYRSQCSSIQNEVDLARHYLLTGFKLGLNPSPLFHTSNYLNTYSDVAESGLNPLLHFLLYGRNEQRDPCVNGCKPQLNWPSWESKNQDLLITTLIEEGHYYPCSKIKPFNISKFGTSGQAKIIFVSHELSRTGAPLILLNLVKFFTENSRLEAFVISDQGGDLLEEINQYAHVLINREHRFHDDEHPWMKGLLQYFMKHLCEPTPTITICNSAGSWKYSKFIQPFLNNILFLVHESAEGFPRQIIDELYSYSKFVLFPSKLTKDIAKNQKGYISEKTILLPQGLLRPEILEMKVKHSRQVVFSEFNLPHDSILVLGCGTRDHRKGFDLFLEIAKSNKLKHSRYVFLWIGGDDNDSYQSFTNETHLNRISFDSNSPKIIIPGSRKDPSIYFSAADIFLLTSRMDPFPCVIHESMAAKTPIICFEGLSGAPEALYEGGGWIAPRYNLDWITSLLCDLQNGPNKLIEEGDRAYASVQKNYCFKDYWKRIVDIIQHDIGADLYLDKN